jgi:Putative N-acetylmannosamine-6-phosphate epimerase
LVAQPIFMLTRDDRTVPNALEIWREVESTDLLHVGVKDVGIAPEALAEFVAAVHAGGRQVMLELVSGDEPAELASARAGVDAGVDYLLGGTQVEQVVELVRGRPIRYLPFAGEVAGHPLALLGEPSEIAEQAARITALDGVHGVDLLAFRHERDPELVIETTVAATSAPVIVAGSIDSPERARRVSELGAWGFTVGTAILAGTFDPAASSIRGQVETLLRSTDGTR